MSKKFNIDDRVILTGEGLLPCHEWPVWGSEHSCAGTITDVDSGILWVKWDNGVNKMLLSTNLSHFDTQKGSSLSPNIAFKLYKRNADEENKER